MVPREVIREYVERLARKFKPEKIILFGSYAYGRPRPDSDVDLLVVKNTRRRAPYEVALIQTAVPSPFPVDLLIRSSRQIRKRVALGDSFIREITTQGKVLYEAAHP